MNDSAKRILLPDGIQKIILESKTPNSFSPSDKKEYDLKDNEGKYVELKSGLKGGNICFSETQSSCDRIIYFQYDDEKIEFFELSSDDVAKICSEIKIKNLSFILSSFIEETTPIDTIKYKEL